MLIPKKLFFYNHKTLNTLNQLFLIYTYNDYKAYRVNKFISHGRCSPKSRFLCNAVWKIEKKQIDTREYASSTVFDHELFMV